MRRNAPYSAYNRAIAFRRPEEGPFDPGSALQGLAVNELQMLWLIVKWSECHGSTRP